jgi:hypothetical protein
LKLFLLPADVNHEEKYRRWGIRPLELVLYCGELRNQLSRKIRLIYVCIMMRKVISRPVERIDPGAIPKIDLTKWIQNTSRRSLAVNWLVRQRRWSICYLRKRGIVAAEGNYAASGL